MPVPNDFKVAFSAEPQFTNDTGLIDRIVAAYQHAVSVFDGHGESQWEYINARSAKLHSALISRKLDIVTDELRHPANNDLLFGFDDATRTIYAQHKARTDADQAAWGSSVHWRLVRLAEAIGAIPVWLGSMARPDDRDLRLEALLARLDHALGFKVDFPNPFFGEFGLQSSRGLINHRALLAIYQAWRLSIWANASGHTRVLEIGAGSGRTAYYSRKLGMLDYTIVDLPLANAAQANFLGRVLDPSLLILSHEDGLSRSNAIKIFSPRWFFTSDTKFDVALNADSITEIDSNQATRYFQCLSRKTAVFVSINHEANTFRASDLPTFSGTPMRFLRHPYWLDDGYVEELFLFSDRVPAPPNLQAELNRLGELIRQLREKATAPESRRMLIRKLIRLTFGGLGRVFK
jgi:hypothetical protein